MDRLWGPGDALNYLHAITGNWTNVVRIVPNSAVKFLTYEQLSRCAVTIASSKAVLPTYCIEVAAYLQAPWSELHDQANKQL